MTCPYGSLATARRVLLVAVLSAVGVAHAAQAAPTPQPARQPVSALGTLTQVSGSGGCIVDRSTPHTNCASVRALVGPAPFLGSRALTLSPDGRSVYAASSTSDAIAIFRRNARTGALTQGKGKTGCIAAKGASGCASARGLNGPNSVAVSPDGRFLYATSLDSDGVTVMQRNRMTGALTQLPGPSGCISGVAAIPGCASGRALEGPDVVTVSPDGKNVYVGSFIGNAVVVFARNAATGALTQPTDTTGCLAAAVSGCATGIALGAPEGMAVSADGASVYIATAASNAVLTLQRNASTGALTQTTDGTGCLANTPITGCGTGIQVGGANALIVSPDNGDVYVTSLTSNSVTSFTRATSTGLLTQQAGTSACAVPVLAIGCSLARSLISPEGVAISPDGASVYAAAYNSGTLDTFDRSSAGALKQKPRQPGCITGRTVADCTTGRALSGVSALAVSPDGRYVYAAAFKSNAVTVFTRVTKNMTTGSD
ncbi:MAG: beta-propeller fold lactonase family protein [Solirubrobacteraceae bacterium]|nr:beta-propeller fold lactonase family protein [Solirubrobacteraceae bacterium]